MINDKNLANSAIRVFCVLQKLLARDCSKSELLENFSEDSLLVYLSTLKKLGAQIAYPSLKNKNYSLETGLPWFSFSSSDIKFFSGIKKYFSFNSDYLSIVEFNEFLLQIIKVLPKDDLCEIMAVINQKPFGEELHKKLKYFDKCIKNKTMLLINYSSPLSRKNYFRILPQEIKISNSKVYLWGYDETINERRCLRIERIIKTRELISSKIDNEKQCSVECMFDRREEFLLTDDNIEILEEEKNKIKVKIFARNKFSLIQKILSYGNSCTILEPDTLKSEIKNKLKLILENYE